MSLQSATKGATRRWVVALSTAAALALVAFLLLLRPPEPPPEIRRDPGAASVALATLDEKTGNDSGLLAVREESLLRDPTPLFHPTLLNSAQSVRPESMLREPGDSFVGFEPKSFFDTGSLSLLIPPPVVLPRSPSSDLGRLEPDRPFLGFGSVDRKPYRLAERRVHLEIYAADQGNLMMETDLNDISLPEELDWSPLELLARTDAAGLVGQPPFITSSRSEAVDKVVHEYLEKHWVSFERRARLPPGAYRIVVGP